MSTITKQQAQWMLDNADIMKAWADGKQIQFSLRGAPWWTLTTADEFTIGAEVLSGNCKFRIKQEPKRFWVNVYSNTICIYRTRSEADANSCLGRIECIEVVEVLK